MKCDDKTSKTSALTRNFTGPCRSGRRSVLSAGTALFSAASLNFSGLGNSSALLAASNSLNQLSGTESKNRLRSDVNGFGRAKRCIMLFMWGGPSQLDTLDPKPDAPVEVRGEFRPIVTATPGIMLSEHFRRLAALTEHVAIVRSLNHDDPAHLSSAHTALTGHLPPVNKSDAEPPGRNDSPHLGAVVAQFRDVEPGLPSAVTLPWKTFHPAAPGGESPGQTGGWLGRASDPMLITGDPSLPGWTVPALKLLDGLDTQRLQNRRVLLQSIDLQQRLLTESSISRELSARQQQAFRLLGSSDVRQAFDLSRESSETRERYGKNIHGQCVLLGRRLLESGVPFVNVNWHNDGKNFWDTHGNNFARLRNDLIPPADQALSALLTDLLDRGMLEDTLVVWVGEFGRRPQISVQNAGREHHPFCYSGLLAGGGIRGGMVYGRSDAIAMHPEDNPVSPHDLAATMLHSLGIPATATLNDATGRPHWLYSGNPITGLF